MKNCKPIKDFEDRYAICEDGTVYNIKRNKPLAPYNNYAGKGYLYVALYVGHICKKKVSVHRLLAEHFIDNPNKLEIVNHKDGNTLNNSLQNLEWVTHSGNMTHSARILQNKHGFKSSNYNNIRKIPIVQYNSEGIEISRFESILDASNKTNISTTYIRAHLNGQYKRIKGYTFKKTIESLG